MPAIPQYSLGRHFTWKIQGYSNSAGTLTLAGSELTLSGVKKGFDYSQEPESEDVHSDNSTVKNNVTLVDDQSIAFEILHVNGGTDPDPLLTLFRAYEYFKITWSVGSGSSLRTLSAVMKRGPYKMTSRGRGASMGSAEFLGVDVDTGYLTVTTP